jgi:hypothetical protein
MEKKKEIKAGNVVLVEYSGENRVCDKAIGILLQPFRENDKLITMGCIDVDTEEFIDTILGNAEIVSISVIKGKWKDAYFNLLYDKLKKGIK